MKVSDVGKKYHSSRFAYVTFIQYREQTKDGSRVRRRQERSYSLAGAQHHYRQLMASLDHLRTSESIPQLTQLLDSGINRIHVG